MMSVSSLRFFQQEKNKQTNAAREREREREKKSEDLRIKIN